MGLLSFVAENAGFLLLLLTQFFSMVCVCMCWQPISAEGGLPSWTVRRCRGGVLLVRQCGFEITQFALRMHVLLENGDVSTTLLMSMAGGFATMVLSTMSGTLSDVFPPRWLLLSYNMLAGAVCVAFVFLVEKGLVTDDTRWPFLVLSAVLAGCDYAQDPPLQKIMSENVSRSLYSHMNGLGHAAEAIAELVAPPAATFVVLRGGLLGVAAIQLCSTVVTVTVLFLASIKERTMKRSKSTSAAAGDAGNEQGGEGSGSEEDDEEEEEGEEEWLEMVPASSLPPSASPSGRNGSADDGSGMTVPSVNFAPGDTRMAGQSRSPTETGNARARRLDRNGMERMHDSSHLSEHETAPLLDYDSSTSSSPRRGVLDSGELPTVPEEGTLYRHQGRILAAASDVSGWLKGRLGRVWHCGVDDSNVSTGCPQESTPGCIHRVPGARYVSSLRFVRMTQSTLGVISRNLQLWWTMFLSFSCILLEAASDETFLPFLIALLLSTGHSEVQEPPEAPAEGPSGSNSVDSAREKWAGFATMLIGAGSLMGGIFAGMGCSVGREGSRWPPIVGMAVVEAACLFSCAASPGVIWLGVAGFAYFAARGNRRATTLGSLQLLSPVRMHGRLFGLHDSLSALVSIVGVGMLGILWNIVYLSAAVAATDNTVSDGVDASFRPREWRILLCILGSTLLVTTLCVRPKLFGNPDTMQELRTLRRRGKTPLPDAAPAPHPALQSESSAQ